MICIRSGCGNSYSRSNHEINYGRPYIVREMYDSRENHSGFTLEGAGNYTIDYFNKYFIQLKAR